MPAYFDEATLGSIKKEAESNEYLRLGNIKKIISAIHSYNENELGFVLREEEELDASKIAQGETSDIQKLVQLILGVVVECENKVQYIQSIMALPPDHQKQLMFLIAEVI
jgi:DNA-directed RNA polymerase subunit F